MTHEEFLSLRPGMMIREKGTRKFYTIVRTYSDSFALECHLKHGGYFPGSSRIAKFGLGYSNDLWEDLERVA